MRAAALALLLAACGTSNPTPPAAATTSPAPSPSPPPASPSDPPSASPSASASPSPSASASASASPSASAAILGDPSDPYLGHPATLMVVAVSEDDGDTPTSDVAKFARAYGGATFFVVRDTASKAATAYKPATMPATYVVDAAGIVRDDIPGWHDGEGAALDAEIARL